MDVPNWQRGSLLHAGSQGLCMYQYLTPIGKEKDFEQGNEMTWSDVFVLQIRKRT